jgi:polysaccharide pyruvyl transferase WcaK-like protein
MSSEINFFVWGYYGAQNIGDDTLLSVVIDDIRAIHPMARITILWQPLGGVVPPKVTPYVFPKNGRGVIKAIRFSQSLFSIASSADVIVFGGGTQFFDNSRNGWRPMMAKWIMLLANRALGRAKVLHYGVGVGTIATPMGRWLFARILALSDYLFLRDPHSYEKVRASGGDKKSVLMRDLAYTLNWRPSVEQLPLGRRRIGLSFFRYYKYVNPNEEKDAKFVLEVESLIFQLLQNSNSVIYLFAFQGQAGNRDNEFAEYLRSTISKERIVVVSSSVSPRDHFDLISQMDICLGMRYHFVLFAVASAIPVVAIEYSVKVAREMELCALSQYGLALVDFSATKAMTLLAKASADEELEAKLVLAAKSAREGAISGAGVFREKLADV